MNRTRIRLIAIAILLLSAAPVRAVDDEPVALLAAVARSGASVHFLDAMTLQTERIVDVGNGPHDVAVSHDGRIAVVPLLGIYPAGHDGPVDVGDLNWRQEPSDGYAMFDSRADAAAVRHAIDKCERPHGAAMSAEAVRVYVTCEDVGEIREIDPLDGTATRTFRMANGVHKVMYLGARDSLVASNPDAGEAYLIDLDSGRIRTIETGAGAEALAANRAGTRVYVANSFDRSICEIDVATARSLGCFPSGGAFPIALAVDEPTQRLWVAHNASADIVAISLDERTVTRRIELPSQALGLAFDACTRSIYVGLPRRNEVLRIDADTGSVVASNATIGEVDDLDLVPDTCVDAAPDT